MRNIKVGHLQQISRMYDWFARRLTFLLTVYVYISRAFLRKALSRSLVLNVMSFVSNWQNSKQPYPNKHKSHMYWQSHQATHYEGEC